MLLFKDTKTAQIIINRWSNKNMETYFEERSKAFLVELKKA